MQSSKQTVDCQVTDKNLVCRDRMALEVSKGRLVSQEILEHQDLEVKM